MPQNVLFAKERQQKIYTLLKKQGKVLISDLCKNFEITPPTARSDLKELEQSGLIIKTHGGAILKDQSGYEEVFSYRKDVNIIQKKQIAQKAAELVFDGATIIIDSGTTALEFAKCICDKKNITVVTCDLKVAMCLQDSDANVIFLGGAVRKGFYCTTGSIALSQLNSLCADICFLGTTCISSEKGISTPDAEQAELRRFMLNASTKKTVLCDSSKFGKNSFHIVAKAQDIDVIITDSLLDKEHKNSFKETKIIIA